MPDQFDTIKTATDVPVEYNHRNKDVVLLDNVDGVETYGLRMLAAFPEHHELSNDSPYDASYNLRFFIRAYRRPGRQARHVVLVYNGLDEVDITVNHPRARLLAAARKPTGRLFDFYDDAGRALARHGYLVILLPTPYHLNRALVFKSRDEAAEYRRQNPTRWSNCCQPTEALKRDPALMYRNHALGACEAFALAGFLTGRTGVSPAHLPDILPPQSRVLLKRWVSHGKDHPQVSLLGYSLGGLRALTDYAFDREQRPDTPLFSACVSFNSGGCIAPHSRPGWVEETEWANIVEALDSDIDTGDGPLSGISSAYTGLHDFAEQYMLVHRRVLTSRDHPMQGEESATTQKRIANRGLFFILGGQDNLFPLESVTDRFKAEGGVTIFHLAGVGHIYSTDTQWQRWKHVAFDTTRAFLDDAVRAQTVDPHMQQIAEHIAILDLVVQRQADSSPRPALSYWDREISPDTIDEFTTYTVAHFRNLGIHPRRDSLELLLMTFKLALERQLLRVQTYSLARKELALGMILSRAKRRALSIPKWDAREADPRYNPRGSARIGEWLLQNDYTSAEELKTGLAVQQQLANRGIQKLNEYLAGLSSEIDEYEKVLSERKA